jgi:hypothetical protein
MFTDDLDRLRAVLDLLLFIELRSPGRGARRFHPDAVGVTWKST